MKKLLVLVLGTLVSSASAGQSPDIPLVNWTVPPFTQSIGGITTMTDATPPRVFVGVQPCRLVDTRGTPGFPAGFGPPSLAPGVPRNFDLDNGPCPGLPLLPDAYSLNVTVVNPAGPGHLVIFPQGGSQPTVSSINYVAGQTIANAVIVAAGLAAGVTVVAGVSGTNVLIDINGYFSSSPANAGALFYFHNDSESQTALFANSNSLCSGTCGVSISVSSGDALFALSSDSDGNTHGVIGSVSGGPDSAGVLGRSASVTTSSGYAPAGVRAHGSVTGVLGIAQTYGVLGDLVNNSGAVLARGVLGYNGGATKYAVFAEIGGYGSTGMKMFVEPHPSDASKVIRYVSLEGPEAGTYFRGKGRIQRGIARIAVPEDFRMVTDEDGLTVQVTPVGPMATISVLRYDLNEIVVQSSRNVEFFYLVQGVRRTYKDFQPIGDGREYMPARAEARLPEALADHHKELLIRNGTYKADGTVNMHTAQRLGWDRIWARRESGSVPAD